MEKESSTRIVGFREWVTLPLLELTAIKAKIDTGAKTSSLHAFDITLEEVGSKTYVNFKVHPLQRDETLEVACRALLVDRRVITDSGGHKEKRYVIRTSFVMGKLKKKIELTLTNRRSMKYRMLIGRAALSHFYIDPSQSYLTGKTSKQRRYLRELKRAMDKDASTPHQS